MTRIPPLLKVWVEQEAKRNACSQNSEIVRAIRERMERKQVQNAETRRPNDGQDRQTTDA